jgi:hypothetical protein
MQVTILSLALSSPVFAAFVQAAPTSPAWENYGIAGLAAAAFYMLVMQLLKQAVADRKASEAQLSALLLQMKEERAASEERFGGLVEQVLRGEERAVDALTDVSREVGEMKVALGKWSPREVRGN